tara:strand:+ start:940 stop:1146 length:207 start_codon:yes stop_codon:yes gene_type:complete
LKARQERRELALFTAWNTERFAREEKLRGLDHYLKDTKPKKRQTQADMLEAFRSMQADGAPIKITRLH